MNPGLANTTSARLPSMQSAVRIPRSLRSVGILGTGSFLPEGVLSNSDLESMVDTSDEWIVTRTGMRERRIAAPDQATSDLAIAAGRQALEEAQLEADEIDLVIVATTTPDHRTSPPTSAIVQHGLGATRAGAFDVTAACTSFLSAWNAAYGLIASGTHRRVLVIGAEKLSSVIDYTDRDSCVLFGDGAGAVVLGGECERGQVLQTVLGADGSGAKLIQVPAGGSRRPFDEEVLQSKAHLVTLEGRRVFKFAVAKLAEVVRTLLEREGATIDDLDLLVPHQANLRILEAAAESLGLPAEKMLVNIERTGNTSAASVPIALAEAKREGRLEDGQLIALCAFGGGLTWGGSLIRW